MSEQQKKEITSEDAISYLEAQVNQSRYDLENTLLPQLGHSEAKRLLLAAMQYPLKEVNMSDETVPMIKAYSACKVCIDALVAVGTELVLKELAQRQDEQTKEVTNG